MKEMCFLDEVEIHVGNPYEASPHRLFAFLQVLVSERKIEIWNGPRNLSSTIVMEFVTDS